MTQFVLVEASPYRVSDGVQVDVRLAGGGQRAYDHRGFTDWRSGVAKLPRFRAAFGYGETGFTGNAIPQVAPVVYSPSSKDYLAELADDFLWIGAPITVRTGDDDLATPVYLMEMTGTIAAVAVRDGSISFTVTDLSGKLDNPLTTKIFAGTGGLEGIVEAEGRLKRRSFGKVRNVEGFVLDKATNVYEFGDTGVAIASFDTVSDIGRPGPLTVLAAQATPLATLDALKASSPPQGGAVVAPSIACVKWWTQPSGPLTADFTATTAATPAQIASLLVQAVAGPAFETSSYNAVDAARNVVSGLHINSETETVASAMDRLLIPMSIVWSVESGGTVRLALVDYATPVETLAGQSFERLETYRPTKVVKVGYRKNHRVHTAAEISAAILTADIDGLGTLATRNFVQIGDPAFRRADGTTTATEAVVVTSLGTAASIAGQSAFATDPRLPDAVFNPRANVLPNGGFALRLSRWTPGVWNWQPGSVEGAFAATATAGTNELNSEIFPASESAAYSLQAEMTHQGPGGTVNLDVAWYINATGTPTTTAPLSVRISGGALSDWTRRRVSFVSPPGALFCRVRAFTEAATFNAGNVAAVRRIKLNRGDIDVPFTDEATSGAVYPDGTAIETLRPSAIGADVTSANQAASILNQAATATNSSFDVITGASRPANNATVGAFFGGNLRETDGGVVAGVAAYRTSDGTAAAFTGQGALATRATARFGLHIRRADDVTLVNDADAITSLGAAASIAGQGRFATRNAIGYGDADLTGFGSVATRTRVRLGADDAVGGLFAGVANETNAYFLSDATAVTSQGQSASIAGQSAYATYTGITPVNMADRIQKLQGDGNLESAAIYKANVGGLSAFFPEEVGSNRTQNQSAASFAGQGPMATDSRSPNGLFYGRANLVRNGGFQLQLSSWTPGAWVWIPGGGTDGAYIQLTLSGTNEANSADFPVTPNAVYSMQAELFTSALTTGGVFMDILWLDGATSLGVSARIGRTAAGWDRQRGAVQAPATANTARIRVFGENINVGATVAARRIKVNDGNIDVPFSDELTDGAALNRSIGIIASQRNMPAINALSLSSKYTGAVSYSAAAGAPATATITIAAGTMLIGGDNINYNAMSANVTGSGGSTVTFFLYVVDADYSGGSKTLFATTGGGDLFAAKTHVNMGQVSIAFPASGTVAGSGSPGGASPGTVLP